MKKLVIVLVTLVALACGGAVEETTSTADGGAAGAPAVEQAPELVVNDDGSLSLVTEETCSGALRLSWLVESDSFPDLEVWAEPRPTAVGVEETGPGQYLIALEWQDAPSTVLVRGLDAPDAWASCG